MFAFLSLLLIASRRARFSGTTLTAPYRWTLFSLTLLGIVEIVSLTSGMAGNLLEGIRYAAATATFCPLMAVLGAKRPQNVGWQWIVGSFWGVLILPVGEMLVLWRGGEMDEGPARQWFLVILLAVSFSNYALTRYWFAASLATVGQTLLLLPQLPFAITVPAHSFAMGAAFIAVAIFVSWWQTHASRSSQGWDGVWLDFRDAFGLVWSLRVMERFNATSRLANGRFELTWYGFADRTDVLPDAPQGPQQDLHEQQRASAIRTLLRRFVSEPWIEMRLADGTADNPPMAQQALDCDVPRTPTTGQPTQAG